MASLFLRFLTVGGMVTAVLLPLLLGYKWLEGRYSAQTRWILWLSLAGVLLTAPLLPQRAAPVQVEVPAYTLPLERTAQTPKVSAPAGNDAEWVERPGTVDGEKVPAHTDVGTVTEVPQVAPVSRRMDWTELAAAVWLGIAALLLAGEGLRYLLVRWRLMKASCPTEGKGVRLRILPGLGSPVTVGFCRPVVFLPTEETDPMALRHELTHIGRRDIWGKALLFLVCALYWFHPLVWLMARRADRDVEAACDAQMAEGLSPTERKAYGALLLASAGEAGALPFATRFGGSKAQMKARLTQLFRPGKRSRTLVCVLLAAALLLSGLVACRPVAMAGAVPDNMDVQILDTNATYGDDDIHEYYTMSGEGLDDLSVAVPNVLPVYKNPLVSEEGWLLPISVPKEEQAAADQRLERYLHLLFPDQEEFAISSGSIQVGRVIFEAGVRGISANSIWEPEGEYWIGDDMTDEALMTHPLVKAGMNCMGISDPQVTRRFTKTYIPHFYGVEPGDEGLPFDYFECVYQVQERTAEPLTRAYQQYFSCVEAVAASGAYGLNYVRFNDAGEPEKCGEVPGASYRAVWERLKESVSVEDDAEVRAELYYDKFAQPGYFVPCYRFYVWNEEAGRYDRKAEARLVEKAAPEEDKPSTGKQVTVTLDPEGSVWPWGISDDVLALIRSEHAEMERLRNLALDPKLDLTGGPWFSREELEAAGYPLEEELEGLTCFEVTDGPASREELENLVYAQFEPGLAQRVVEDCLGGSWPLCFFADGKLWHRDGYGTVWFEYDWSSLRLLNANEDKVEYTLDGYSNANNSGDTPERKRWAFTLVKGKDGAWRYTDTGREIFNEDADSAPTYAEWSAGREREHPDLSKVSGPPQVFQRGIYTGSKDGWDLRLKFERYEETCVLNLTYPTSSIFLSGTYTVEGDRVVYQDQSLPGVTYVFRVVDENTLRFEEAGSAQCRDPFCVRLTDGDTFLREEA